MSRYPFPSRIAVVPMAHANSDCCESSGARPSVVRVPAELRKASRLVETAAYDTAGENCPTVVSRLMLIAAELERIADKLDRVDRDE